MTYLLLLNFSEIGLGSAVVDYFRLFLQHALNRVYEMSGFFPEENTDLSCRGWWKKKKPWFHSHYQCSVSKEAQELSSAQIGWC